MPGAEQSAAAPQPDAAQLEELNWPLGSLESLVLHSVWRHGDVTVRMVMADIATEHPVAYTTVMTVMVRMAEKGLLRRQLSGKTHIYSAALSPEEFAAAVSQRMFQSLVSEFGDLAIAQFAAELARVDPQQLRRLKQLTKDAEA